MERSFVGDHHPVGEPRYKFDKAVLVLAIAPFNKTEGLYGQLCLDSFLVRYKIVSQHNRGRILPSVIYSKRVDGLKKENGLNLCYVVITGAPKLLSDKHPEKNYT